MMVFKRVNFAWRIPLVLLGVLAGCDDDAYLPGKRISILPMAPQVEESSKTIALPAAQRNVEFPLRDASKQGVHYALPSDLELMWRTPIGQGDGKRRRWSASPVAKNGVIYTMDSRSVVSAVGASAGALLWQTTAGSLVDADSELMGGGLSASNDMLFAATAFGTIKALDLKTGAHLWTQKLEAGANGSPTYHDGFVYFVSANGAGWKLRAKDGKIIWRIEGRFDAGANFGGSAPAVGENYVAFINSAGEISTHYVQGGTNAWVGQISGGQVGRAISAVNDVISNPVIADNAVYVSNFAGTTAKYDLPSGDLLWVAPYGTAQQILSIAGVIFLVDNENQLVRINARTGTTIWRQPLPLFDARNVQKRKSIIVHHGPLMAGGALILGTSDGKFMRFDPQTGAIVAVREIDKGATTTPLILDNRAYVINREGELMAFSAKP